MKMDMETLAIALLFVLVLVSGIQSYQLINLKATGGVVTSQTSLGSGSGNTGQTSSQMVGGC